MNGFVIVGLLGAILVAAFIWLGRRKRRRADAGSPLDAALPFIAADHVARHAHGDAPGGDAGGTGGGDAGGGA